MRPLATREGDDYVFTWPTERLTMVLAELREHSSDLYAELTVHGVDEDGQRYHLTGPLKANLLGTTSRSALAKAIAVRDDQERGADVWTTWLEQALALTVRAWREGEPVISLNGAGPALAAREYLLTPLLPRNETTMLYADGAGGKSFLALWCALAVSRALPLADGRLQPGPAPVPVLYLDWETHAAAIDRRWSRICAGMGIDRPTLHYLRMQRPLALEVGRLRRVVAQTGAGLVIVDSAGFAAAEEIQAAEAATRTVGALHSLGVTGLLLHHMSKAAVEQQRGRAEAFGTIYWRNAVRNAWELRSDDDDDRIALALYHRKTNEGRLRREPIGLQLCFEEETGPVQLRAFDHRQSVELNARRDLIDQMVDALLHGPLTIAELADAGIGSKATLAVTASRWNGRRVKSLGDGRWAALTADGTPAVPW